MTTVMLVDVAPKPDILEQWEMEEKVAVRQRDASHRLLPRQCATGEKAVERWLFQATEVREATEDERRALMEARKRAKAIAKQRRVERKAERGGGQSDCHRCLAAETSNDLM